VKLRTLGIIVIAATLAAHAQQTQSDPPRISKGLRRISRRRQALQPISKVASRNKTPILNNSKQLQSIQG
jgi:hypothetical protein